MKAHKSLLDDRPEVRTVRWIDSSLQNGQVDASDFPKPFVITSVGFVVRETDEYLVLARDDMGHDGDFRGLCAIPKVAVIADEDQERFRKEKPRPRPRPDGGRTHA